MNCGFHGDGRSTAFEPFVLYLSRTLWQTDDGERSGGNPSRALVRHTYKPTRERVVGTTYTQYTKTLPRCDADEGRQTHRSGTIWAKFKPFLVASHISSSSSSCVSWRFFCSGYNSGFPSFSSIAFFCFSALSVIACAGPSEPPYLCIELGTAQTHSDGWWNARPLRSRCELLKGATVRDSIHVCNHPSRKMAAQ